MLRCENEEHKGTNTLLAMWLVKQLNIEAS